MYRVMTDMLYQKPLEQKAPQLGGPGNDSAVGNQLLPVVWRHHQQSLLPQLNVSQLQGRCRFVREHLHANSPKLNPVFLKKWQFGLDYATEGTSGEYTLGKGEKLYDTLLTRGFLDCRWPLDEQERAAMSQLLQLL